MSAIQERRPDYAARISLMEAIDFTSDDIMANRQGKLSNAQKAYLRDDQSFWNVLSRIVAAVTVVLIALTIWDGIRIHDSMTSRIEIVVLTLVIGGVLYIETYHRMQQERRDLVYGQVESAEGRVELRREHRSATRIAYKVALEDMDFNVEKRVFDAFEAGRRYRIYYAPYVNKILSAEPLDRSESSRRSRGSSSRRLSD